MAITGYSNRLSVAPGETIQFMVSCDSSSEYRADIVRLTHGDTNPAGPGLKETLVQTAVSGQYPGRKQVIHAGSYVLVPDGLRFQAVESFSVQAVIYPTTPEKGVQGLLTKWSACSRSGYGLFIDEQGCLALWLGDAAGNTEKVNTRKPLIAHCWYYIGASIDSLSGQVYLYQKPILSPTNARLTSSNLLEESTAVVEQTVQIRPHGHNGAPLILAGYLERFEADRVIVGGHYNGKLEQPCLSGDVLDSKTMNVLAVSNSSKAVIAAWDFAAGLNVKGGSPRKVIDQSPNQLHGETVNCPSRSVTGHNWTSEEQNFIHAPEQYGAIYFHEDDLDDARWTMDFELTVPEDLKSGVYAARLSAGDEEDYIPFCVRPRQGIATACIVLLIPTASYIAYANEHAATNAALVELMTSRTPVMQKPDLFLAEHREYGLSTYDTHSDGSGVCYSSRLRPILNMRPKYKDPTTASVWQFNADLDLVDWLSVMGYEFDVVTDEDLHCEGVTLLQAYNVILTGSHPEYYSAQMLDALATYQQMGGRLMYMGANGFYWVTAFHPEQPGIIEVRKWGGTQAWRAEPGECYLSFTGELGGLWRNRGRAPQKLVGTGFIAQGFDASSYYRRQPDSFDPRAAWIFAGVAADELIGNFGLVGGGAAGLELDSCDRNLGTPDHALLLASSEGHTDGYWQAIETLNCNIPGLSGSQNLAVRADMVYYTLPEGGAVFSVSSLAWCGSLSHNNYDNNVSRITNTVLKRFVCDQPLPLTTSAPVLEKQQQAAEAATH